MKRRIAAFVAALMMTLGLSAVVAAPARASFDWCHGISVVCFAADINGNGARWGPTSLPYGRCVGVPSYLNDRISSLWNKYGTSEYSPPLQLTLYRNNPCNDWMYTWGPDTMVNNIGRANNDIASAVCIGPRTAGYCPRG